MHSHDFVLVEAVWFIFLITGITATITQGPSNTVAEIGQQVKLNCTDNSAIDNWFFSKDGIVTDQLIIVGPGCSVNPQFDDHYAVDSIAATTCNLIVFNITMEQAGVYRCEEIPDNISSILTVIDSPPVITVNSTTPVVEDENVVITCSLSFSGSVAPAPTLRPYFFWKDINGKNVNSSYNSTTKTTAVSQLIVTAAADKNITSYTCHVYLQLSPPATAFYANNIPTVSSSASSPTIEVLWFPRTESTWISVAPVEGCDNETCSCSSGYDGFTFLCSADSYPGALYQWIGTDNSVVDSEVYPSAQTNGIYRCTAYFDRASSNYTGNYIFPKGTSEKNVIECFELTDADSNSSDVAIAMGVLFCISFVVNIIFVIWIYNHQQAKEDQFKRTENALQPEKDLSNGTSAPSVYEELRRPDETRLQQATYEALAPNPAMHAGPIIPKTGSDTIHNLTQDNDYVNAK